MDVKKKMMHVGLYPGDVGQYVFLPGSPERAAQLAKMLDHANEVAYNREYRTFTGTLEGIPVSVTSTGMGGPSTAIAVEELHECGARTMLRVGTCESLSRLVKVGQLVLPNGAVRMEGVAQQYAPLEFPAIPDMSLFASLAETAGEMGITYHIGIDVTKACFSSQYAAFERPVSSVLHARWQAYRAGGALCADMGCAPLFVAARTLGVRAAAVLAVAFNDGQYSDDANDWPEACEALVCDVAVAAMRKLILQERDGVA